MDDIRIAIVGYGGMGSSHGGYLWKGPTETEKNVNATGHLLGREIPGPTDAE